MASRASLIQSRSIYVGTANNVAPSDGNLIVTGNVGIGTTSPESTSSLHIVKTSAAAKITLETSDSYDSLFNFSAASNEYSIGFKKSDNTFRIANANTLDSNVHFVIASGGNVGIGTTAPQKLLHINGGSGDVDNLILESGYVSSGVGVAMQFNRGGGVLSRIRGIEEGNWNGGLLFEVRNGAASNPGYNGATNVAMKIATNGNVGIGTTSPTEKLHINGRLRVATIDNGTGDFATISGTGVITRRTASEVLSDIGAQASLTNPVTGTGTTNYVPKWTGASALGDSLMVSNSTGIGIGISNPTNRLYVQGQDSNNLYDNIIGVFRGAGTSTTNYAEVYVQNDAYDTLVLGSIGSNYSNSDWAGARYVYAATGDLMIKTLDPNTNLRFYTAGSANERMRINASGNVGIGTTAPGARLDVRGDDVTEFVAAGFYNTTPYVSGNPGRTAINIGKVENGGLQPMAQLVAFPTGTTNSTEGAFVLRTRTGSALVDRVYVSPTGKVGIGTTAPVATLTIGSNEDIISTNGIALGAGQASLEFVHATFQNGFGSKLYSVDSGGGTTSLRIATRANSTSWSDAVTIIAGASGNGNVGIGTTAPTAKLTIQGSASEIHIKNDATNSLVGGGWDGTSQWIKSINLGVALTPLTFQASRFTFDNGNVGIGTTSPISKQHNVITSNGSALMLNNTTGGINAFVDLEFNTYNVTVANYANSAAAIRVIDDGAYSGHITFRTKAALVNGAQTERMRIQSSTGNVGIGTTAPPRRLSVIGDSEWTDWHYWGATSNSYSFAVGRTSAVQYSGVGEAFVILRNSGGYSTAFLVDQDTGNVGIGTTAPAYKLDVSGTIRATGDVIAYSDARVKENVETLDGALDKVMKMRGVSYNKIGEYEKKVGVIAQEILKVLPEVVSQDETGTYSVAYGNITAVLIEAIKELTNRVEELESKLKQQ